ncbi:cytochrome b/b6 domain-containing protein [Paenarthrobacter nicotinovorans]|uniref:cytochrome b/b6 domain-containing protein n=1 Tax=Paenarthrobacter nicotinovorans TaxID=29320 RepID=UPI0027D8B14E|nr:cytochrome b/b6 domain-containing protein [Paenarthrobacter nicotinovorans]
MSLATKPPSRRGKPWAKWGSTTGVLIAVLFLIVLAAKGLRELPGVQEFLAAYPGWTTLPKDAPVGLPAWLGWQHFLNAFFLVLSIRSGWLLRTTTRPKAYWTRRNQGAFKTRGKPTKIGLDLWLHLSLDALWALNGAIFIVLLFVTGQWMRIVPTSLDVVPNALSALLQYASLDWPLENGWTNYNALQLLAYFTVVFLAAPLAIITGLRMSAAWPKKAGSLNMMFPIEAARAIHFPTMIFFALFIITHVTLVLATGALRNLNHMYAAADDEGWAGFWFFAGSLAITTTFWLLVRPVFLRPVASFSGTVTRS